MLPSCVSARVCRILMLSLEIAGKIIPTIFVALFPLINPIGSALVLYGMTGKVDERTWIDHFGYPHSGDMHLTERYKRTYYDTMELQMTIDDPKVYTKPWNSQLKKFRLIDKPKTAEGWQGLMEDVCAPIEDVDQFNKRIRDPAGGVLH